MLLAAPVAVASLEIAPAEAAPRQPYHLAGAPGHGALQPADWSARDDDGDDDGDEDWHEDRDDDRDGRRHRRHWRNGKHRTPWQGWSMPYHGGGIPHLAPRPLPRWVVEHRLRRQHVHPIGPISLRHGLYVVPVLDRFGRRVVIVVDPTTAVILGRARHW